MSTARSSVRCARLNSPESRVDEEHGWAAIEEARMIGDVAMRLARKRLDGAKVQERRRSPNEPHCSERGEGAVLPGHCGARLEAAPQAHRIPSGVRKSPPRFPGPTSPTSGKSTRTIRRRYGRATLWRWRTTIRRGAQLGRRPRRVEPRARRRCAGSGRRGSCRKWSTARSHVTAMAIAPPVVLIALALLTLVSTTEVTSATLPEALSAPACVACQVDGENVAAATRPRTGRRWPPARC